MVNLSKGQNFMKSVDTGKEKVKKICDVLKRETIEPAKKEASGIIHRAKEEAQRIVEEAKRDANHHIEEAQKKIQEERNVFQASIHVASKKCIDLLKQQIEKELFSSELDQFVSNAMKDPATIAKLISVIVEAIEKEGMSGDLQAIVPTKVPAKKVNDQLIKGVLSRLKNNSVDLGDLAGGAQIKLVDKNLTIDMSEEALKALIAGYVRDDFRAAIFSS